MKTYLPNETKAERKARKALTKQSFSYSQPVLETPKKSLQTTDKVYVICLKWGNKYGPEYVHKLANMVQRHLTVNYEFICFTDDTKGLNPKIKTFKLPVLPVSGWWYKPWFLSDELPIKGTALFFDLDLVIFSNIDKLFTYKPESKFVIIRDFNRHVRKNWDRMNSSVFRLEIGSQTKAYQEFRNNITLISKRFHGDQDFMYKYITKFDFWPDEWIQSYKWEMRGRNELGIVNGKRNFKTIGVPVVQQQTSVAVFHGDPNPADCTDQWVVDNWR